MNKYLRISIISLIFIFLVCSVGYASFLVSQISNQEGQTISNTYDIEFHFVNPEKTQDEISKKIVELEEDSIFELPHLNYDSLFFDGWSLDQKRQSALQIWQTSVKELKEKKVVDENYDFEIVDQTINFYAVVYDVKKDMVLITVTDETANSLKYFLKVEATTTFSLFNISYAYPNTFVNLKVGQDTKNYSVNDIIDITPYSGGKLEIVVSSQE